VCTICNDDEVLLDLFTTSERDNSTVNVDILDRGAQIDLWLRLPCLDKLLQAGVEVGTVE
jgi:hypothetical protein